MSIGNWVPLRTTANQAVTSSTALVSCSFNSTIPIKASEKAHARFVLPFSVGAAGGFKFQLVVPAGGTSFQNSILVVDTVTPGVLGANQTSSAAFANALAVAGTHICYMDFDIVNGSTAGVIDLQFAQNSSNGTPITILLGASVWITYFN